MLGLDNVADQNKRSREKVTSKKRKIRVSDEVKAQCRGEKGKKSC